MKRKVLIGAVVVGVGAAGGGLAMATADREPAAVAEKEVRTSKVTRQDLVHSERISGTLGYTAGPSVRSGRAGTITALPAENSVVERGGAAFHVDDAATTLLYGTIPLWRELALGVGDGPDVRQLEENLVALGAGSMTVDEKFTSATENAVEKLQERLGIEETGRVSAAWVVIAVGPVRIGDQKAAVGDRVGPDEAVYATTLTTRVITAQLSVAQSASAKVGGAASVTLPNGRKADATVSEVGAVTAGTGEGGAQESTVPVTLTLADPAAAGDAAGAPVSVDLVTRVTAGVLTVPVPALLALAEGGYAVQRPGGELVAVEIGAYASGRVEVRGDLTEGAEVVVPS